MNWFKVTIISVAVVFGLNIFASVESAPVDNFDSECDNNKTY